MGAPTSLAASADVGSVDGHGVRVPAASAAFRLLQRRPLLVAAVVGCVLYLAAASIPTTGLWSHRYEGDQDVYSFYAGSIRAGNAPYRDFLIEYPPAALAVFVPPQLALEAFQKIGARGTYADFFKTAMLICGLLLVLAVVGTADVVWRSPRRTLTAAVVVGVSPLVLGPTALSWYDMWPTLLTFGAVALFVRRRFTVAFTVLGVAVAAKLFALVLLPLLLLQLLRTAGRRHAFAPVIGFVSACAVCFGSAAVLSLRGARYPFAYLLHRPVEIESTPGSIVGFLHVLGWQHAETTVSYGSVNFSGTEVAVLALVLTIAGVLGLLLLWRRAALVVLEPRGLIAFATGAIAITLASSKVFSPQYMVWLVPFVALTPRRLALPLATAAAVLTRIWFPERWGHFDNIPPLFTLALLRNLAVGGIAVLFLASAARYEGRQPPVAPL